MESPDYSAIITALATGLLVLVGLAQVFVLVAQKRQQRLDLAETYRKRWQESLEDWAAVVFVGREEGAFYQVASKDQLERLTANVNGSDLYGRDVWAVSSIRNVSSIMSDVALRILQGQLTVSDAYPIFGTELLRHSYALRALLDPPHSQPNYGRLGPTGEHRKHDSVRHHLQEWLIYHDGIRRRCLILIDLLWAEAARLEDLPPDELKSAADAKRTTGALNRARLGAEHIRLRGRLRLCHRRKLLGFLRHAEYRAFPWQKGLSTKRLQKLEALWTERLLSR